MDNVFWGFDNVLVLRKYVFKELGWLILLIVMSYNIVRGYDRLIVGENYYFFFLINVVIVEIIVGKK